MFIYLYKKIAIPNQVKLRCCQWNTEQVRSWPPSLCAECAALALAMPCGALVPAPWANAYPPRTSCHGWDVLTRACAGMDRVRR
jgi:hypothetical protein